MTTQEQLCLGSGASVPFVLHKPDGMPLPSPFNAQLLERATSGGSFGRKRHRRGMLLLGLSALAAGALLLALGSKSSCSMSGEAAGLVGGSELTTAVLQVCPSGSLATSSPRQPRLALVPGYLPREALVQLQAAVRGERGSLTPEDLAAGLSALNVRFNTAGVEVLRKGAVDGFSLRPFYPFFAGLRLPDANAWSLNVIYSQPQGIQRAGRSGPQDPHMDNLRLGAEGVPAVCTLFSHQTSAFYLWIPPDMKGGNLTLMTVYEGRKIVRQESVRPQENLLATFRGDLAHAVEPFSASGPRISLTLEQYRVPKWLYWATEDFTARKVAY